MDRGRSERHPSIVDFLGFLDPAAPTKIGQTHYDRPILGGWEALQRLPRQLHFACGIGSPEVRRKECTEAERRGLQPATLVFPNAVLARHVDIGEGTVIGVGVVVGPCARLGRHCVINHQTTVGHDARLGDFCVVSPGARVLGNVVLGECVFIGTTATVFQGRCIGAGATLGANSFLISDLKPGQSAIGVPASPFSPPRKIPATPHIPVESIEQGPGGEL
ncbi:MAG: epsM [Acidobacteriaceae bacterium]|nr:epsM [Acidobacteriaceae bacterium]